MVSHQHNIMILQHWTQYPPELFFYEFYGWGFKGFIFIAQGCKGICIQWCQWWKVNDEKRSKSIVFLLPFRESIIFMDFCANTLLHEAWPHLINQSLWNLSAFGIHSARSSWSCWVVWKPYSSKHESYALGRNLSSRSCLLLGTSRAVSCQKNNVAAGHGEGKLKSRSPRTSSSRISACPARWRATSTSKSDWSQASSIKAFSLDHFWRSTGEFYAASKPSWDVCLLQVLLGW